MNNIMYCGKFTYSPNGISFVLLNNICCAWFAFVSVSCCSEKDCSNCSIHNTYKGSLAHSPISVVPNGGPYPQAKLAYTNKNADWPIA